MSLLALAAALAALAAPARPNIVLVTIDTLRADHLGSYGSTFAATPNLDTLARTGIRFEHAVSPVPLTRPAHASLLTGLYPHEHGLRDNLPGKLDSSVPTLATRLRESGYETGAFVGSFLLGRGSGLESGFVAFGDGARGGADRIGASAERHASAVTDDTVAFLETARRPFFLWVHYYDPHAPYEPPEPFEKSYAGEVAYVDRELGRLLRAIHSLGLSDSTWILVTADHGEGLGEHGEEEHGVLVYESTLRIPLILKRPGEKAAVEREPVSLVDVFPTLLEAAGIAATGPSLLGPKQRPLYFESYYGALHFGWAPLRGVREGSMKLIFAPRSELFDLSVDPNETRDRSQARKDVARRLYAELEEIEKRARTADVPESLAPGDAEKLASLGYLAATVRARAGADPADPKDEIGKFSDFGRLLREAMARFHRGEWQQALPLLQDLAGRDILSFEVHLYLARCHRLSGDVASALREYEAAALIYDDYSVLHLEWGRTLLHREKLAEAAAAFERSLEIAPSASAAVGLATALRKLGDASRAIDALRKAVALDENDADSWNELGALLLSRDEVAEAIEAFEKAVSLRPGDELFRHNLAFARERASR